MCKKDIYIALSSKKETTLHLHYRPNGKSNKERTKNEIRMSLLTSSIALANSLANFSSPLLTERELSSSKQDDKFKVDLQNILSVVCLSFIRSVQSKGT